MAHDSYAESMGQTEEPNAELVEELRDRLTEAVIKCSERCLYQSAKW
jgi:hypothetical protein